MRRSAVTFAAAAIVGITGSAVAGCGSSSSSGGGAASSSASSSASPSFSGSITVFAASSLLGTFTQLGKQFEAAHPGVKVTFGFGASSTLATQIVNGAPADVFASASPTNMQQVITAGDASNPVTFANNVMEVAVPPANPAAVTSVDDLAKSSVKVALCQPQVPCGVTAAKAFKNAKITVKPVTLEPDVKSVLSKVELDAVDAGVVYVTDVRAAGTKVKGVQIPANLNASTAYPIAPISKSSNAATARAFAAYVASPAGESVLAAAGFEKP
ncbi:MAG TPA: molybdate ABC transporter substrate-binding protein [Streptosporangiaceae bacterium]|nr:molybdate ABC transporter substrate-binding protein [Streptosporangiaceae bacterium]